MASEVKCEVIIDYWLEVYNLAIDSVIFWLKPKKVENIRFFENWPKMLHTFWPGDHNNDQYRIPKTSKVSEGSDG